MAIIAGDWVPGALVPFGGLRFIVNLEGGLERVCSPDADGSDFIVESLRRLWLDATGACASPHARCPLANRTRTESATLMTSAVARSILGQSTTDLAHQHGSGTLWGRDEPPGTLDRNAPTVFPFGLSNTSQDMLRLGTRHVAPSPMDTEPVGTMDRVC